MRALAAVVFAALVLAGAPAAAQDLEPPRRRQGYWIALGLLGAVNQNWDDGEAVGPTGGAAFGLRLGQKLTRRFGLGLELESGGGSGDGHGMTVAGLGLEAQWELAGNLALHGGLGLGVVSLEDETDPDAELQGAFGARYSLGLSWGWFPFSGRRSGGFALSPVLRARLIPGDDITAIVGLVGLELTWWTGLPRNQLELPEGEAYQR